jgi:hypothetical protein
LSSWTRGVIHKCSRYDTFRDFDKPEFANAGYAASIDIASLPAGQYEILIAQKEGKNLVCSTKHTLDLKG